MRIYVNTQTGGGQAMAVVEHNGQQLLWNVSAYAKTSERATTVDIDKMFNEINAYWTTDDKDNLDAIWNVFVQIREVMDGLSDFNTTNRQLRALIGQLYRHISIDQIKHWMLFNSAANVRMPNGLKDAYEPNDPVNRTYLREDYHELAALAIALRPMVPIWGEYIVVTKDNAGAIFKEYMALSLMHDTYIIESPAMEKLRSYVKYTIESLAGEWTTPILGGLSSEELPEWVMAVTLARRLAVGEVSSVDDSSTVISNVFNFILSTWRSIDKKFGKPWGGKVSEKKHYSDGGEEDKTSNIENYKVKQQVADGELVIISVYTENPYQMATDVDPTIPLDYVDQCLQSVRELQQIEISSEIVTLTQCVLAPSLSPRGIPLLPKPAMLSSMAVAQALLWHWKFYDLAALTTASKMILPQDMFISITGNRNHIPKDLQAELARLYPHQRRPRSKQENVRKLNVAYRSIDELCDNISSNDWYVNAPESLLKLCAREGNSRRMSIPVDIRTQLAQLSLRFQ